MDFRSDGKEKRITYVIESMDAEEAQKILRENGYHVVSQNDRMSQWVNSRRRTVKSRYFINTAAGEKISVQWKILFLW